MATFIAHALRRLLSFSLCQCLNRFIVSLVLALEQLKNILTITPSPLVHRGTVGTVKKLTVVQAWPLVQSLPELLHHAPTVVAMLLALLEDPAVASQVSKGTSLFLV